MSRNISKLSGRKGLKDNLFKRMIDTTQKTQNGKEIKQLAEEYQGKVKVVGLNVDHAPDTAGTLGVMGIPVIIFFKDGPFSWHGIVALWIPYIAYFGWILAMSYALLVAAKQQGNEPVKSVA